VPLLTCQWTHSLVLSAEHSASSLQEDDYGVNSTAADISFMRNPQCDTHLFAMHMTSSATRAFTQHATPSLITSGGQHSKPMSSGMCECAINAKSDKPPRSDYCPLLTPQRRFFAKYISTPCSCRSQEASGILCKLGAHSQHGPNGMPFVQRLATCSATSSSKRSCTGGAQ